LHVLANATAKDGKRPSGPRDVTTLYLSHTRVTDEGLKELEHLKNLQRLHLGGAQVTDAGLRTLREIGLLHVLANATAKDGKRPSGPRDVTSLDLSLTPVT